VITLTGQEQTDSGIDKHSCLGILPVRTYPQALKGNAAVLDSFLLNQRRRRVVETPVFAMDVESAASFEWTMEQRNEGL